MASPWKLLARLVSSRRQPKQDDVEDVKPDVLAIAGPAETTVEESLHIADRPADEQPLPVDRSNAVSIEPEQSEGSRSNVVGIVENGSAKPGLSSGTVLPDVGVIAAKVKETAEATRPERRTLTKKVEAAAVVLRGSPAAPSASDEIVSLNEEIAVLRTQLATKLRLQNAQLKKMLARFER
jgi:hypothetical protein